MTENPGVLPIEARARLLSPGEQRNGPAVYWMSRDQRTRDNAALLFAQRLALARREPLLVCFCLAPRFPGATWRAYDFLLRGLAETAAALEARAVPFVLLEGEPAAAVPAFVHRVGAGALVTDFDPLRVKREWVRAVAGAVRVPFHEVDAHNAVPCWLASPKLEFAARTFRPKLERVLDDWLHEFPALLRHPHPWRRGVPRPDFDGALRRLAPDRSVAPVASIAPGERAAQRALAGFVRRGLAGYDRRRNDPTADGQSGLSPWLHFGQLSALRVALAVRAAQAPPEDRAAFLEELLVRRELSDNFCLYQPRHDSFEGLPAWAQRTLDRHRRDLRPYRYADERLESGSTHDPLWNAAQRQLVDGGKMHGWVRMYWAKKILEWTASPEEAIRVALRLNDRYSLDGRDPNGCVGVLWSVGGLHDRPWGEREVFGQVRYMSLDGARRKFDVDAYVRKVATPPRSATAAGTPASHRRRRERA
jgi:deoxyribodipyrimidine photo-lyase